MPEGDTIHRAAATMRPVLVGQRVVEFEAHVGRGPRPAVDAVITDVRAVGKHHFIDFDDGVTLRTHMRMTGSWHMYRFGEKWRRPAHTARARVVCDNGWLAVCFAAPVVETYHRAGPTPDAVAALGPDLCTPDADLDAAVRRLGQLDPGTEIADALLDQRVACGIGNVYKSEVLFLHAINPFTPVADIDAPRDLFETAQRLLLANVGVPRRVTYRGGLGVYGRNRQSCRRCGDLIRSRPQGPMARVTYWCRGCQAPPTPG